MIDNPAAPGPCHGQAAICLNPGDESVEGNHGGTRAESFGDAFRTKGKSTIRVVFFNPNGVGSKGESFKMLSLYSFLRRHEVDVIGLSETNVDWRLMDSRNSMWGRVQTWFESRKIAVAHNLRASSRESSYQAGGTSTLLFDKLANNKCTRANDPTRLGRWSSILVGGKGSVKTRFVTVYCPCRNTKAGHSVFQQHLKYYKDAGHDNVCPINQFWVDIKCSIKTWMENGEQLVVGGDWNHPISKVNQKLEGTGLSELITSTHGLDSAPNTYNRGSKPIDGIYTNSSIEALRCGYLPFNKGVLSDHRMLWMDLRIETVLGFSMYPTSVPAARRLKLDDPRIEDKYNQYLADWFVEHKLYDLGLSILKRTTFPLAPSVVRDMEKLERLRNQGMIAAEKRCRKLRRGAYSWSPDFSVARDTIKLWTMVLERKQNCTICLRSILRVSHRLTFRVDLSLSVPEVKHKIDLAWTEYKNVKLNSKDLRKTFLRSLAEAKAAKDGSAVASKLRSLIHREDIRRVSTAVKYTLGKLYDSGTTRVLVPNPDGGADIEIVGRSELEHVLLTENPKKYHRHEPYCQLMHGQLFDDIGICGNGPRVPDILNGSYVCPPGTTRGTALFLQHMKRHPKCDEVKHISERSNLEEFCNYWKRAKERSSSFGPIHNAHYKAGCRHDEIKYMHYLTAEILFRSGHYLHRHRQGIDVMLLKAADDFRLLKLRTIFLFDAELNMNMGRIGDAALSACIELDDFADEQYSRPNRSAIDHVVNKRLMFDYFYFCKQPFSMCSCDLAGNYDCIVHAAASLALQRVGIPMSRIFGMFDTLQRMIKKVRTAYGDSARTYGGDDIPWPFLRQPAGAYQGNRIGPPLWSVISSTVFSILRKEGFGVEFIDAISLEVYRLVGSAYVDDSDLATTGVDSFAASEEMKKALALWEEIMNATGQAMAPDKSWWYLVDYVWENGEWNYIDGATRVDLTATDSDGVVHSLKRLVFSQAKKMLGVFLAPNGDTTEEIKYLKEKADKWADMIRVGHLGPVETWIALSAGVWKTLLYPMAATTLSAKDIRSITKPIMDVALPRMMVNRNVSVAIRYGPPRLGGLGLPDPYCDQGIKKVQYLVEHLWKRTPTGNILQRCISGLCIEGGFFGNPFGQEPVALRWVNNRSTWISFVWDFMYSRSITIDNLPISFLEPRRHNDVSIMLGLAATGATDSMLKKVNACRLFLQVVGLSDITVANGTRIDPSYLLNRRVMPTPSHRNSFRWPRQPCPPLSYWKLWTELLKKAFCTVNNILQAPLGNFIEVYHQSSPKWDWFGEFDSAQRLVSLWKYTQSTWVFYAPLGDPSRRTHCFSETAIADSCPGHTPLVVVTVAAKETGIFQITSRSKEVVHFPPVFGPEAALPLLSHPVSADEFLTTLGECAESSWFITRLLLPAQLDSLFIDFLRGKALTVSDGSCDPHQLYGTACWRLESLDRSCSVKGYCIVPGRRELMTSYRSECCGLLGISLCLWSFATIAVRRGYPSTQVWEVLVACDGYSALQRCMTMPADRLSTQVKQYDVIAAVIGIWRNMPCKCFPVHVKGHQDRLLPSSDLTRLEVMNISVDRSAKAYLRRCIAHNTEVPSGRYEFGLPTVKFAGAEVSTELYKTLMNHCTAASLRQYWIKNLSIAKGFQDLIAWKGFERGMIMLSRTRRIFIVKWLSRQINVGPVTQRYDSSASKVCLRCRKETETLTHCIQCRAIRKRVLERFEHFYDLLRSYKTSPQLLAGIIICTKHWLSGMTKDVPTLLSSLECWETIDALALQFDFGWFNFLQGIHLSPLVTLQQEYFESEHPSKSLHFWHGRVISSLWNLLCGLHEDRKTFLAQRRDDLDPSRHPAIAARETALRELSSGRGSLSALYHQYFLHTPADVRKFPVSQLRDWLRTIRLARDPPVPDAFSPMGKYRAWLLRK